MIVFLSSDVCCSKKVVTSATTTPTSEYQSAEVALGHKMFVKYVTVLIVVQINHSYTDRFASPLIVAEANDFVESRIECFRLQELSVHLELITMSRDSDHGAVVSHTLHAELVLSRSMLYVSCITVVLVKKDKLLKERKKPKPPLPRFRDLALLRGGRGGRGAGLNAMASATRKGTAQKA